MDRTPDVLMLPLATALDTLRVQGIAVEYNTTRPRSKKFNLLDENFVVRVKWIGEEKCNLVVAAKMGKEVR